MGYSLLPAEVVEYVNRTWVRDNQILAELREETAKMPDAQMQISPDEGAFLAVLVKMLKPEKVLEIGVFTGFSSLSMALALPPYGRIIACDVSEEYTSVARRYWERAEVSERIELRLAPASETLQKMIDAGEAGSFDLAFIDADKPSYLTYYEHALQLLRVGGVIAVDNVLWSGRVADPGANDTGTEMIREFNARLHNDERIELALAPVGDGLTLAIKR